jgi:tetratricopeptide (TPR) repeat protein
LRRDVAESLGDALKRCGVDYYLLVSNEIPPLIIIGLVIVGLAHTLDLAFIDRYNEAVAEVNRILNIARNRGSIYEAESLYGLGLVLIIANAAILDRDVKSDDADTALHIAASIIQRVTSPGLIKLVLDALEPLHGKAPHRYLELLALASKMENLDSGTVRYIFDKLNEILDKYGDVVREYAWSLVHAISAYAALLRMHIAYVSYEVEDMVGRVVDLLNELGRFESKLGVIAWADALAPALVHEYVRRLVEKALGIDVIGKASEVLKELNDMRNRIQELMRDEEFMSYIESGFIKANEEAVKKEILQTASLLKKALAHYRLDNDELDEAKELIKEAAEERREIGDYRNYLVARGWALRVETIEGSLVDEKLVDEYRRLYEETFSRENFILTADYLSTASGVLGEYLVSLALTGNYEMINELLEEHLWVLNADKQVSVLTRLMLNALLSPRGGLSSELKAKLSVNPEELIDAFGSDMIREFLPALRIALGMIRPRDGVKECKSFEDSMKRWVCREAVRVAADDSEAVKWLRERSINYFNEEILENERSGWLREPGFDVNALINEFGKLMNELDGRSLVQLVTPFISMAQFALMLHALINGNKELAKAHALKGAINPFSKLLRRLFLEAYRACCDLGKDEFRRAIARLFFLHV